MSTQLSWGDGENEHAITEQLSDADSQLRIVLGNGVTYEVGGFLEATSEKYWGKWKWRKWCFLKPLWRSTIYLDRGRDGFATVTVINKLPIRKEAEKVECKLIGGPLDGQTIKTIWSVSIYSVPVLKVSAGVLNGLTSVNNFEHFEDHRYRRTGRNEFTYIEPSIGWTIKDIEPKVGE